MPENSTGNIAEILKWGWVALIGVLTWMWNRMVGNIDQVKEELSAHKDNDSKAHENFIHKDDWAEFKSSLHDRFDKLEAKEDKILDKVIDGVDRTEFKQEIGTLYSKIDSLEQRKADK